jgi:Arc-like DNA binding domain
MSAKKSTDIVPTMLRLREGLRKRLEREAKNNRQSLNAEMVERLEQSFAREQAQARDSDIVDMLIGPTNMNRNLLRWIVYELKTNQGWPWMEGGPEKMSAVLAKLVADVAANPLSVPGPV